MQLLYLATDAQQLPLTDFDLGQIVKPVNDRSLRSRETGTSSALFFDSKNRVLKGHVSADYFNGTEDGRLLLQLQMR